MGVGSQRFGRASCCQPFMSSSHFQTRNQNRNMKRIVVGILAAMALPTPSTAVTIPSCAALESFSLEWPYQEVVEDVFQLPLGQWTDQDLADFQNGFLACRERYPEFQRITDDQYFRKELAEFGVELRSLRDVQAAEDQVSGSAAELRSKAEEISSSSRNGALSETEIALARDIMHDVEEIRTGLPLNAEVPDLFRAYELAESALAENASNEAVADTLRATKEDERTAALAAAKTSAETAAAVRYAIVQHAQQIDALVLDADLLSKPVLLWDWFQDPSGTLVPYNFGSLRSWLSIILGSGRVSGVQVYARDQLSGVRLVIDRGETLTLLFEDREGSLFLAAAGTGDVPVPFASMEEEVAAAREISLMSHEAVAAVVAEYRANPVKMSPPSDSQTTIPGSPFGFEGQWHNSTTSSSCSDQSIMKFTSNRMLRNGSEIALDNVSIEASGWSFDVNMQLPTGDVARLKGRLEPTGEKLRMTVWNELSGEASVTLLSPCD